MADIYVLADILYVLLFGVAGVMAVLEPKEVRAAKVIVFFATAMFALRWITWAMMSDDNWVIKAVVGALVGAFLFGGAPLAWKWLSGRQETPSQASKEDLRFSFVSPLPEAFAQNSQDYSLTFNFRNFGTDPVFITGVGLYQLTTTDKPGDGFDLRTLSDPVAFKAVAPSATLTFKMTSDGKPIYLHDPFKVTIDGRDGQNVSMTINANSAVSVTAHFAVADIDKKIITGTAFVPVVYAINSAGGKVATYCPGPTLNWNGQDFQWLSGPADSQWFGVLPRNPNDTACRVAGH
jgi:hypothetical protein